MLQCLQIKKEFNMTKKEQTSAEIRQELTNLTNEQLFDRYLIPAGDYNPNDAQFLQEVIQTLRKTDKDERLIYRNIISLLDTKCYNDMGIILFAKTLTNTLKRGYKLNLENYLYDLERMLGAKDNADWLIDFIASNEKDTSCPQFSELCEFIGSKLILKRALQAKKVTLGY